MNGSPNNYAECKKPHENKSVPCMIPFIYNSAKLRLIHSDRNQISDHLGMGNREGQDGEITTWHVVMR